MKISQMSSGNKFFYEIFMDRDIYLNMHVIPYAAYVNQCLQELHIWAVITALTGQLMCINYRSLKIANDKETQTSLVLSTVWF
jgi:hypothetical protein